MYSQTDLDEAVASGAMTAEAANSLRAFVERQRGLPSVDEENFRLITGFNDIFVAIATAILLFAIGWIGQAIGQSTGLILTDGDNEGPSLIGPALVAATSWGLALFFTAKRRMALPSILLVFAFTLGVLGTVGILEGHIFWAMTGGNPEAYFKSNEAAARASLAVMGAIAFAATAAAAWIHWRKFRVPVTVAAGAAAVVGILMAIIASTIAGSTLPMEKIMLGFALLFGVGVFLFAMRWDGSDKARITRRSDVAFWLHLLAAPMIVHPIFSLLGLNDGNASIGEGVVVILVYIVLGLAALAIDRRALLVSALAYVLFALSEMFRQFGAVELNIALTALVIGSALLMLSAFWHQARAMVVRPLPEGLRDRLPLIDRPAAVSAQAA
jgi:hypothetical protein